MSFRRTALAQEMARQLLRLTFLDTSLRSGLFLSGQRRVGKSTFVATDLIPALQDLGAIVIYVASMLLGVLFDERKRRWAQSVKCPLDERVARHFRSASMAFASTWHVKRSFIDAWHQGYFQDD